MRVTLRDLLLAVAIVLIRYPRAIFAGYEQPISLADACSKPPR